MFEDDLDELEDDLEEEEELIKAFDEESGPELRPDRDMSFRNPVDDLEEKEL